ncbi:unnamed protein product [Echinostoma caproni]|uniref:Lipoprotein n=1 Tax=Echinostoma caproni TaxID=27848 RepID=A0A183A1V6_9TREM|nr:unnamed protein product [Echinostoma caproni]
MEGLQDGLRSEAARQDLAAQTAASLLEAVNRVRKFDTPRTTEGRNPMLYAPTPYSKTTDPPVAGIFQPMATCPL